MPRPASIPAARIGRAIKGLEKPMIIMEMSFQPAR
jgi:hypothetical protein